MDNNANLDKYGSYEIALQMQQQKEEKSRQFKERLAKFEEISTLEDAKILAAKTVPTSKELCAFYVGNAKCVVVNNENMFRISFDTENEFICYSFE